MRLAEMVRELRKENEELKYKNDLLVNRLEVITGHTAPQVKLEPVAMRYDFDGYGYLYIDSGSGSDWQTRIKDAEPLYTAPRELSDEEIEQIYSKFNVTVPMGAWLFARAILKKASEK
jgi:hypothetical protein